MSDLPPFPTLKTDRLVLREIVEEDSPTLFSIYGDADLMRWLGVDPLPNQEAVSHLVKIFSSWRNIPNPGFYWGIQQKDTNALIGTIGLFAWNRSWKKCSIGYELAHSAQGKGFMQEALVATLSWGFREMELNRVEAQVHPNNLASLKSVRRQGFVEEGCLRKVGFWGGCFHDLLQFSLLSTEWECLRAQT
ncbi:GNAT family N-acetyltransferase [Uliginosibacterium sp. TH139]|uniref:GNAT family N-acetyltransferase n=1 Tax=Uliginosibacterium sp. TH139 TaxID=2067453 RepID=UPI000C7BAB7F|nr:GNAT family protein [Uliginosibacterium sp. TH139]PLK50152.1 GNAT family N-acetyltransferase [Uliginosibacterium sp. TH139]